MCPNVKVRGWTNSPKSIWVVRDSIWELTNVSFFDFCFEFHPFWSLKKKSKKDHETFTHTIYIYLEYIFIYIPSKFLYKFNSNMVMLKFVNHTLNRVCYRFVIEIHYSNTQTNYTYPSKADGRIFDMVLFITAT